MAMEKLDTYWSGMLTVYNVPLVTDLLLRLLDGKRYTFVAANEARNFRPEVVTGQYLDHKGSKSGKAINIYHNEGDPPKFAGFNVVDNSGVWGCSTSLTDNKYDPEHNSPYLIFEHDKVTIIHRAPAGNLLYWVAAIEHPTRNPTT